MCVLLETFLKYWEQQRKQNQVNVTAPVPTPTARIQFTRNFTGATGSNSHDVIDALVDYISNVDTVTQLKYTSFYVMNTDEEFEVNKEHGITGKVCNMVLEDTTGTIKLLSFYLQSNKLSITELREWVSEVHNEYMVNKNNELGSRRYFFNQLPEKQQRGAQRVHLNFDMSQFETTKTLNNLYGDHIDKVQSRIELFQNKTWYQRNGVPHTLGILLYGQPGCGKTSLIKAIANDTNRHVFNIRLADTMTKEQLSHLFFDHKVHVRNKETGVEQVITIPLNQRLYVLEDVDCAENTVFSRTLLPQPVDIPVTGESMFGERELDMIKQQIKQEKEERIDLAFLLNILDGVLETPQRLIIMTTNYPSKLDAALLRPGRIDLILEFKRCSVDMLLTMVQNFYENVVDTGPLMDDSLNEILTPAEVQEILCNYIDDAEGAVQQIKTLAKKASCQAPPCNTSKEPCSMFHEYCTIKEPCTSFSEAGSEAGSTTMLTSPDSKSLLCKIMSCSSNLTTLAPQVVVDECKSKTRNPLATLPVLNPSSEIFDTVPGLKPITELYREHEVQITGKSTETSTNLLPAADAMPEPRREPKWLKYQM